VEAFICIHFALKSRMREGVLILQCRGEGGYLCAVLHMMGCKGRRRGEKELCKRRIC